MALTLGGLVTRAIAVEEIGVSAVDVGDEDAKTDDATTAPAVDQAKPNAMSGYELYFETPLCAMPTPSGSEDATENGDAPAENNDDDEGPWTLTLAINGQNFTEDCGTFSYYAQPTLDTLEPASVMVSELVGSEIKVHGAFSDSATTLLSFGDQVVTGSFDEEAKTYTFVVPEMDVEGKGGTIINVDIALNGQQFTGNPLGLEIEEEAAPVKGKGKKGKK